MIFFESGGVFFSDGIFKVEEVQDARWRERGSMIKDQCSRGSRGSNVQGVCSSEGA